MQGMLSDYLAVKEEAKEFETFAGTSTNTDVMATSQFDFNIQCLKTGNWPAFKAISLQMPPHINEKFEQFKRFYSNKHQRR